MNHKIPHIIIQLSVLVIAVSLMIPGFRVHSQTLVNDQCQSQPLWSDTFTDDWETRFNITSQYDTINREDIVDPIKGSSLRVNFLEGSRNPGPSGSGIDGGTGFRASPFAPQDELCLTYDVKFGPDFDFVRGGKLPGLAGGTANTGGDIPDGTDGFSARYMWRNDGDGEAYMYIPSSISHGTSFGTGSWRFVPDRWYTITQRVKLNTPGVADGEIAIFVDGVEVYSNNSLLYRTQNTFQIDMILFETFFGGSDDTWSATKDEYIDFSRFGIYQALQESPSPAPESNNFPDSIPNGALNTTSTRILTRSGALINEISLKTLILVVFGVSLLKVWRTTLKRF